MNQAKRELETLPPAAQREMVRLTAVMDDGGRKAGGRLAQGINAGLIRNSPIIAAAVGGALAAGAPAAILGATALFGGIGAVAAAQSSQVQAEWRALGEEVSRGALKDAGVLIPALSGMADDLGASFARLRPQLRAGFEGTAPLIDNVTDGVTALAENAMPGLLRSLQSADPVMDGFESFLADTGTGIGEFFGGLADNAPAAGTALGALGSIVGDLLPLLGEFLGTGAELAAVVLPPVADAVGEVADAAQALGPVLPAIVAGFTAMKVAGSISGGLTSLAGRMDAVRDSGGRLSGVAGDLGDRFNRASSGFDRAAGALPALGIVIAGIGANMSDATRQEEEWAAAILAGGDASVAAYEAYAGNTHWGQAIDETTGLAASWGDAKARADEMRASMSPLELAQARVQQAQRDVNQAVGEFGESSPQARAAMADYEQATSAVEREQGRLELALHGVTQAMVDQANQALTAIDSNFAYQHAVNQLEDAQTSLTEAQNEHGVSSEEAQRALLDMQEASYQVALAFGQQQADMSGAGKETAEYARIMQEEALAELYRLRDAAGPGLSSALTQQIQMLQASGVTLGQTGVQAQAARDRMRELGLTVRNDVPGYKGVVIDAPTGEQRQRITDLGYTVRTLPDGRVYVSASTADAEAALAYLSRPRTAVVTAIQNVGNIAANIMRAAGGPIGPVHGFDSGGAVHGPGGPTDDLVPALGPDRNARYRLSNGEHIITAAEVRAAGGHGAIMEQRQMWLQGFASGGAVSHRFDDARRNDPSYMAWWKGLLAQGWKGRPGDREERIYAPVQAAAPRAAVHSPAARPPAAAASVARSTGATGGDCSHPLFNIERAEIHGPPQEVARQLALEARTHGRR